MSTRSVRLALPFLALFVGIAHFTAAQGLIVEPADIIVIHGRVYTEDPRQPWVQAVAIRGAKIVAVGDDATIEKMRGIRPHELTTDRAEMLVESPAPNRGNLVARLQHRTPPGRLPAANQTRMPPVFLGQELDNQRALAMSPGRQHEPGIPPLHQTS